MFKLLKKTLAVCLFGLGLRNSTGNITSDDRLAIFNWSSLSCSRLSMASMLRQKTKECMHMKIVVKKVPRFLRGFVKLIFGMKE